MIFEQVKAERGDNFSYFIGDEITKEVAIVDPGFSANQLTHIADMKGWIVKYIINTHFHHDHTFGNETIASRFNAKIVAHKRSGLKKDIAVEDGDFITIGKVKMRVIYTIKKLV